MKAFYNNWHRFISIEAQTKLLLGDESWREWEVKLICTGSERVIVA